MGIENIINRTKQKWYDLNHPKRVFGGKIYRMKAWASNKRKVTKMANDLRAKGYNVRIVYAPLQKARKIGWGEDPLYLSRFTGHGKEIPAWDIYIRKG